LCPSNLAETGAEEVKPGSKAAAAEDGLFGEAPCHLWILMTGMENPTSR